MTLRGQIVDQELDNEKKRPEDSRLSYKQLFAKYPKWGISPTTIRQQNRKYTDPEGARERAPVFTAAHIEALRQGVAASTDNLGVVSWARVVEEVKTRTNRTFW